MKEKVKKWLMFCLAGVLAAGTLGGTPMEAKAENYGENLIINPNFADSDVSAWGVAQTDATISIATADVPIFDDVSTYGVISDRTSPYQCFAQDITAVIENEKKYEYSFYAMLSDDYADAPAEQRVLDFAPYVVVDGQTSYLGSYSAEIEGTCTQTLEPGVWTKYEGVFKPYYDGNLDQVVIRLLEQGTNYGQGECVKGEYYVTGVSIREIVEDPIVLEDIPALCDVVVEDTGDEDMIVSGVIGITDLTDAAVLELVQKHFNAVTFGNALKPDAMFNYSNDKCPGTQEVTLNGEKITVPVMDYSRAEKMLNKVLEWNESNPDKKIMVRGHVLVWHSQTPEWFFHEDYDASKPYVSKEEMDKRQEWYIKSVLEHFTGEDSPYKDMFYAWDVVNEAVSDATGTYRSDKENSSWWAVYQSNEFIISAFRYANKYAPESVELYYNDYNEFYAKKREGIIALLEAVKEAEGTRIDGMGMQGHYDTTTPSAADFETSIRMYAEVAGKVQITELDLKAGSSFDGTDATREEEYLRMAKRYESLYNVIKALKAEGIDINALVVWSSIDKYSWLQSYSGVGGGADGMQTQCPALFDDNYMAKPAYWAFVDPDKYAEPAATEAPAATEEPAATKEPVATEAPVAENTGADSGMTSRDDSIQDDAETANSAAAASRPAGVFIGIGVAAVAVVAVIVLVMLKKKKK